MPRSRGWSEPRPLPHLHLVLFPEEDQLVGGGPNLTSLCPVGVEGEVVADGAVDLLSLEPQPQTIMPTAATIVNVLSICRVSRRFDALACPSV